MCSIRLSCYVTKLWIFYVIFRTVKTAQTPLARWLGSPNIQVLFNSPLLFLSSISIHSLLPHSLYSQWSYIPILIIYINSLHRLSHILYPFALYTYALTSSITSLIILYIFSTLSTISAISTTYTLFITSTG